MAPTNNLSSQLQAIISVPPFEKGQMTFPWQLFLGQIVGALGNTGGTGNTTITTDFGVTQPHDFNTQEVVDLKQKVNYLLANPALAIATEALETQQASNSVTTSADVLDLIALSRSGLLITDIGVYLAALPDSAANLDVTVSWNDIAMTTMTTTPNSALARSNSNTEIQIMGPISVANGAMDVVSLTIVNNDSISANVSLYYNGVAAGVGNTALLNNVLLQPGFTLVYERSGFTVLNKIGLPARHS